jgi:hypothetical protein
MARCPAQAACLDRPYASALKRFSLLNNILETWYILLKIKAIAFIYRILIFFRHNLCGEFLKNIAFVNVFLYNRLVGAFLNGVT